MLVTFQTDQNPKPFLIYFLYLTSGNKLVCMHILHKQSLGFLQLSSKTHWFSNQQKGCVFPVSDPEPGCQIYGLNSLSKEDLQVCDILLPLCVPC